MNALRSIALPTLLLAAAAAQAQDADPRLPDTPADKALYRALGQALDAMMPPDPGSFSIDYAQRQNPVFLTAAPPGVEQLRCERTANVSVRLAGQGEPIGAVSAAFCGDPRHVHALLDDEAAQLATTLAEMPEVTQAVRARLHLVADTRRLPDGSIFRVVPTMVASHGLFWSFQGVLFDGAGTSAVVVQMFQETMCDPSRGQQAFVDKLPCTDPRGALQALAVAATSAR